MQRNQEQTVKLDSKAELGLTPEALSPKGKVLESPRKSRLNGHLLSSPLLLSCCILLPSSLVLVFVY